MPQIFPFKALLPAKGLEIKVSANTHVDDKKKQTEIVKNNPSSYLRVVKPYLHFNSDKSSVQYLPFAKETLEGFIQQHIMIQDAVDTLYVYNQVNRENNQQYLGLICNVSTNDYYHGKIKVHENTLTEKENQLIEHIKVSGAIGEPVLLTHFADATIESLLAETISNGAPAIDFVDEVNRQHLIYKISDSETIQQFKKAYEKLSDFYIADGHHRSAACAGYYRNEGDSNGHYLAFLVPANHLHIDSFYRAFKSNSIFDATKFIDDLRLNFDVQFVGAKYVPEAACNFGLCTREGWYQLRYKNSLDHADAVNKLDVSILENHVFKSILKIQDSKTDQQLTFIKGNTSIDVVEKDVMEGIYDFVFTVYPCSIESVFEIADKGMIMPPKSTYIEPKLRTGLTVQKV